MDKVLNVISEDAEDGSKWRERQVCRPCEENDGSFRRDTSGKLIVLAMLMLTITAYLVMR